MAPRIPWFRRGPQGDGDLDVTEDEARYAIEVPRPPGPRIDPNLVSRLAVAVPGVLIAIGIVYAGGVWFALAMCVLACLALLEFYSLTAATRPLRWAGYLGALVMILMAWQHDTPPYGALHGMAIGAGLIAVAAVTVGRVEDITVRVSTTALGLGYVGLAFAMLMALRELPHGGEAVANVLVGVWVFDTASYVGGKTWGHMPVAPRISPGKTLEGLVVGLVCGVLAVVIAGLYIDWLSALQSFILGLVICISAFVGDLFESALKRDAGAKDSGRLLMGHGGVLDRFDALMFASVAAYFTTVALVY